MDFHDEPGPEAGLFCFPFYIFYFCMWFWATPQKIVGQIRGVFSFGGTLAWVTSPGWPPPKPTAGSASGSSDGCQWWTVATPHRSVVLYYLWRSVDAVSCVLWRCGDILAAVVLARSISRSARVNAVRLRHLSNGEPNLVCRQGTSAIGHLIDWWFQDVLSKYACYLFTQIGFHKTCIL